MVANRLAISKSLKIIQAEYREMPGLELTKPQVRRLWTLDPQTCDTVLDALVAAHFLRQTPRGVYILDHNGR